MVSPEKLDEKIEKRWNKEPEKMRRRRELLEKYGDKSITRIYKQHIKGSNVGMRKQDFLHFANRIRDKPLKAPGARKKYTPTKYKKPEKPELTPEVSKPPATEYKTIVIEHEPSGQKRFIRVPDPESRGSPVTRDVMNYEEQYWKIVGSEGWSVEDVHIQDTTIKGYKQFEDRVVEGEI